MKVILHCNVVHLPPLASHACKLVMRTLGSMFRKRLYVCGCEITIIKLSLMDVQLGNEVAEIDTSCKFPSEGELLYEIRATLL